jgi:peptide/nickel transport system substrate-binding protein
MTRNEKTGQGQYNCGHYSNPEVDKLVTAANEETDPAKRATMLQQVEATLYNDAAFVPLHWENLAWGAKSTVHAKPIVNAMNFPYFGDLVVDAK